VGGAGFGSDAKYATELMMPATATAGAASAGCVGATLLAANFGAHEPGVFHASPTESMMPEAAAAGADSAGWDGGPASPPAWESQGTARSQCGV
jgi:hypothetical protein